MSYNIDFHFAAVTMDQEKALERIDEILRCAGLAFLDYCHELYLGEEGEIDTAFPAVKVGSIKEGAAVGKSWIGRSHYYRWQTHFDLGVYAWGRPATALVLSMNHGEWKRVSKDPAALDKIIKILCSISDAVGSPFGFSKINSNYFPLAATAFGEVLNLLKRNAPEPELFWVAENSFSCSDLIAAAGSRRTVIRSLSGYSLALKVDRDSEAKTSYAKPKTIAGSPDRVGAAA